MRTRAYRAAESIRHSLRNGFTTYSVLSLVIGFLATIVPEKLASQEHDASTEASGPHAFVVRNSAVRQRRLRVHRNPPLVRDDGQRPSSRDGMAVNMFLIYPSVKAKYFRSRGLTRFQKIRIGDARRINLTLGGAGSRRDQRAADYCFSNDSRCDA